MSNQSKSERAGENVHTTSTAVYPKTDERYWQTRVSFMTRKARGVTYTDSTYSIKIGHDGKRKTFQLHTANKREAAKKARDIYSSLKAIGWDETVTALAPKSDKQNEATVGDLIQVYTQYSDAPTKTATNYARVLRTIVAGIKKIDGDKTRFDYVNGGAEKWRKKVDAVKLSVLTKSKIQLWKKAYVEQRATDPIKEKSAKRTVNSYLRYCKSIFSVKTLPYLAKELTLPDPLPFSDVDLYPRQSSRYNSTFDISKLITKARQELPGIEQDQQWLIFLLAVSAGLRRNEIDKLTWRQIDFDNLTISLAATKYFKPKSENSGTVVSIDLDLATLLHGYNARASGEFVIDGKVAPRMKAKVAHYRANKHFSALNKWLHKNGVDDRKPLHTLRKEAGSLVNKTHGLYAASRFLRHADIQVTSAHYVDTTDAITSGLGSMLAGKVESIKKEKEVKHG